MGGKVSLATAIRFTKASVYLAHTWPPSVISTRWDKMKLEIVWWISILSSLGLLVPLVIAIFVHRSNSLVLTQSACFVGAICNYIVKMVIHRTQRTRTQLLINDMENFIKTADVHEKECLQRYVDTFFTFHRVITFVNYMTAVGVICGPIILPQEFPTEAVYPFSLESRFVKYAVYIHQSFVGFQCSTGATIDCQIALMMWFTGARMELLTHELENVSNVNEFHCFVRKHQKLIWYSKQVAHIMRYISLTTSIMCGFGTIFSGLQLMSNQPMTVKMLFGPVVVVAGMNLFVCSWPADNLISVCHMMGMAAYCSSWTEMTPRMMRNYLMIIRRSQRPITVKISGFIPALSLRSYATYISTAFSYTTTLRLVFTTESQN